MIDSNSVNRFNSNDYGKEEQGPFDLLPREEKTVSCVQTAMNYIRNFFATLQLPTGQDAVLDRLAYGAP